jgi:hypothetical protein
LYSFFILPYQNAHRSCPPWVCKQQNRVCQIIRHAYNSKCRVEENLFETAAEAEAAAAASAFAA